MNSNDKAEEYFAGQKVKFEELKTQVVKNRAEADDMRPMQTLLALLRSRRAFRSQHLCDEAHLQLYLEKHPDKDGVCRRINRYMRSAKAQIRRKGEDRAEESEQERLRGEVSQFLARVHEHAVEPTKVFQEMPDPLTVCELTKLGNWYTQIVIADKKVTEEESQTLSQITEELRDRIEYLRKRYELIIGRTLLFDNERALEELVARKAPVPVRTKWSEEFYSRLTTRPLDTQRTSPSSASLISDEESISSGRPSEPPKAGSASSAVEGDDENGGRPPAGTDSDLAACDVAEIYKMAGSVPPATSDPEVRYTFPHRLQRGEDIFYDYALFMPVDECGSSGNEESFAAQSTVSLQIHAGKANAVLGFVRGMGAAGVFGEIHDQTGALQPVISVLEADIRHCSTNIIDSTSTQERRRRRDMLRDRAGTVRQIARTQMVMQPPSTESLRFEANDLMNKAAAIAFGETTKRLPQAVENREDAVQSRVMTFDGVTTIRDADSWDRPIGGTKGCWYKRKDDGDKLQWSHITPYIQYIGGPFFDKVTELKSRAQTLAEKVLRLDVANSSLVNEFQQLFQGLLNDALLALADILDEMAQCLPVVSQVRIEGSKRLGLMLVFRQYWNPEAYVQGKLVGFKNLLPDQRESVKRRTFVKTTRETTTTEEFSKAREDDFSQTLKETTELTKETAADFNFTTSASGHFNFAIGGVDSSISMNTGLRQTSKAAQSRIAESSQKGSVKYSEKREVKIRELRETEDVQEISTELHNSNKEITANYFYYQLLLQYLVTVELHNICPVLLRTKTVPSGAQIDDHFIGRYIHILIHYLPAQLAADAESTAERIEPLARAVLRARTLRDQLTAVLKAFNETRPLIAADREAYNEWQAQCRSKERSLSDAQSALGSVEDEYYAARGRMDRVLNHLRENILHYMQFIWQRSPLTDEDELLQDETFGGQPLPKVTRGLMRLGHFGREEIFEYTGFSLQCFEAMLDNLIPGSEIASMSDDELQATTLFQYMVRYYPTDTTSELLDRIRAHAFVDDPAGVDGVLSSRRVQVAQDALVVEAMPGQVPLLEGFQMVHRMLNVQKTCLENTHLSARIRSRAWEKDTAEDSYAVRRYEGAVPPQREVVE